VNTEAEIFDVVNDLDEVIGQAPRYRVHAENLKHRAIHVFVFNTKMELYIQRRASGKDTFPDCYDSSASGHLETGEAYDTCAIRELREELGLHILQKDMRKLFKVTACKQVGWEFIWVYSTVGTYRPVPNPKEIALGRFWTQREIEEATGSLPNDWAPSFLFIYRQFCQKALWPM